jgi:hypothetical protein
MPSQTRSMLFEDGFDERPLGGPGVDHVDNLDRLARLADAAGFVVEWELGPFAPERGSMRAG